MSSNVQYVCYVRIAQTHLLLLVLLFLLFCMTLAPMVIASSSDMTAIPGDTRTFTCTFIGHLIPYWVVSGGDSPVTITLGTTVSFFTMPTISEIVENGTVARLEVSVDLSLNGTTYVCQIGIVGGTTVASDPAALTVFGRYSPTLHRATATSPHA